MSITQEITWQATESLECLLAESFARLQRLLLRHQNEMWLAANEPDLYQQYKARQADTTRD